MNDKCKKLSTICSYQRGSLWTPHAWPHLGLPKRFVLFSGVISHRSYNEFKLVSFFYIYYREDYVQF